MYTGSLFDESAILCCACALDDRIIKNNRKKAGTLFFAYLGTVSFIAGEVKGSPLLLPPNTEILT
jgi:hypothetical protein